MKLQIGKRGADVSRVESVFRLIGNNEDALTHALGYVFSKQRVFLIQFLKNCGILEKRKGKNYDTLFDDCIITLQELRDRSIGGRKDITIEFSEYRIVIEAKTDGSIPSYDQLSSYALSSDNEGTLHREYIKSEWGGFSKSYLIVLTRKVIPENYYSSLEKTINNMTEYPITIHAVSWGLVIQTIRQFKHSLSPDIQELYKFIKGDYIMKYYEFEVLCRHVVDDERYEMAVARPIGYYFDGGRTNYIYPECLFFCPVTGPSRDNKRKGRVLRRIRSYEILSGADIISRGGPMKDYFTGVHCKFWPEELDKDKLHVFELTDSIPIPESNQNFIGSAKFFKEIVDLLGD